MKNKFFKKTAAIGFVALTTTCINISGASAAWRANEDNTWSWLEDDTQATGWEKIDGSWYYFDEEGIMHTGWLKENDEWYKLSESGSMITGWIQENGKWYYANPSGDLETGRLTIDGITYNFLSDGTMVEDEQSADFTDNNVLANSTKIPDKDQAYDEESNNDSEDNYENKSENDSKNDSDEDTVQGSKEFNTMNFTVRTDEPDLDDRHYYSNDNIFYSVKLSPPFKKSDGSPIRGNCTWYTWGRTWEITGKKPLEAGFTGNAYQWWQANKSSGKYQYGSEPRIGAIAVWNSSLPGSGGCGHVAVVEEIKDGKIYISESMWHGDCFAYKEIYSTEYLYGYIYLDKPNY
ncbi:MAG: CHAP domain-containing protein [Clostridium sp.]|nr:CHAP domain-containing protein [Clostridium sp.]